MGFKNRESTTLNQKLLKVENIVRDGSGELSEILVEVVRSDTVEEGKEGTPLSAESINLEINNIINSYLANLSNISALNVANDKSNLSLPSTITENFTLPLAGINGSIISWQSNSTAITINGGNATVTRGTEDISVELTATITYGTVSDTWNKLVTVKAIGLTDQERVERDKSNLSLPSTITGNFTLPLTGINGSSISWESNINSSISINEGTAIVIRGATDVDVVLTATITYGAASDTWGDTVTVVAMETNPSVGLSNLNVNPTYLWWRVLGDINSSVISVSCDDPINVSISSLNSSYFTSSISNNGTTSVSVTISEIEGIRPDDTIQALFDFFIIATSVSDSTISENTAICIDYGL